MHTRSFLFDTLRHILPKAVNGVADTSPFTVSGVWEVLDKVVKRFDVYRCEFGQTLGEISEYFLKFFKVNSRGEWMKCNGSVGVRLAGQKLTHVSIAIATYQEGSRYPERVDFQVLNFVDEKTIQTFPPVVDRVYTFSWYMKSKKRHPQMIVRSTTAEMWVDNFVA